MEKKDYKHGKFHILTTSTDGLTYEDYVEWCEANDRKPCGEDSGDFECWKEDKARTNYECDIENIRYCKQYYTRVVITGKVGRWDGTHTIAPVVCSNVHEAIEKCADGMDDVDAWFNDGHIEVIGGHHDGNDCFDIYALSAKGEEKYERATDSGRTPEYSDKDFKRLPYLYAI